MNRNMKRYIVIITTACSVAIAGIFLSQYNAYKEATMLVEKQFDNHQMLVAELTVLRIEDNFKLLIKELELLSGNPAVKNIDVGTSRGIFEESFKRVENLYVNDVALLDSRGTVRLPLMAPHLTGTDFSFRDYFKKAGALKKSVPIYEFIEFKGVDLGEKGIVIAMPLFRSGGEFNGVVIFTVKVNELINGFIPPGKNNSDYCVIDNSGNVLYHPLQKSETIFNRLYSMNTSFRTFIENAKTARGHNSNYKSLEGDNAVATSYPLNIAGQTCLFVISTPLKSVSGFVSHLSSKYAITTITMFLSVSGISIIIIFLINRWNIELRNEIIERKRAEGQIERSLEEKAVLLREIHHRVKNNMAIISSLLQLQTRYSNDEKIDVILKDSQNRIGSMALVHEKLYQTKDFVNINLTEYVEELVGHILHSYGNDISDIGLKLSIENIKLGIDILIPFGLIINELVTNSLKHAFDEVERPEINASFKADDKLAMLVYSDNGRGIPENVNFQDSETLGLQIVNILAVQLRGSAELDREDMTTFTIKFMLAAKK
jgi:two-component sensor histidine kinase